MKSAPNLASPQCQAIHLLLQNYFDGLYFGDVTLLAEVFHPEASYISNGDDGWVHLDMPAYFQRVRSRVAPVIRGEKRRDQVLYIDLASSHTALAKVNCAIGEKYFTDFLSLVLIDNHWQIIAKVFHYQLVDGDQ